MAATRPVRLVARSALWAALAGLAAYAVHVVNSGGGGDAMSTWAYNGLLGAAACLCAARAAVIRRERAPWAFLSLGLICWFAGEVYFTVRLADLYPTPVPSVSDVLALAFYPASYVALVLMVRSHVRRFQASMWLDGLVGALGMGAVAAAIFLEPILQSTGLGTAEIIVSLAYPVGDVLLVSMVAGMFALTGWRPGKDWVLVGAGLAAMALADVLFLYMSASGSYREGTLLDVMWPAASLLIAYAAWVPIARSPSLGPLRGVVMLVAPGAFAVAALALLVLESVFGINTTALALATATLVVVVVRLSMSLGENVRLVGKIEEEATTDPLTGLGNRRKLMVDLDEALADGEEAALMTIGLFDLDGFKAYNDAYGHLAGDALLSALGERLTAAVAGRGQAYRLGGDEFCAVFPDHVSGREVAEIAAAALTERGEGFLIGASSGHVSVPSEAATVSDALRLADTRMYRDKEHGGRTSALMQTRDVLLQALTERSPGLDRHMVDVSRLAAGVGTRLNLSEGDLLELSCAAQLHDVGKIAIPDTVLQKPGPLDETEWELMRSHTLIGDRIIRAAPMLTGVARLVRHSHERWDGGGYPARLAGADIPQGSRIIAACDAFDAMTSDRPYRRAFTLAEAMEELRRCAGTQFDPEVIDALIAEIDDAFAAEGENALIARPAPQPVEVPVRGFA